MESCCVLVCGKVSGLLQSRNISPILSQIVALAVCKPHALLQLTRKSCATLLRGVGRVTRCFSGAAKPRFWCSKGRERQFGSDALLIAVWLCTTRPSRWQLISLLASTSHNVVSGELLCLGASSIPAISIIHSGIQRVFGCNLLFKAAVELPRDETGMRMAGDPFRQGSAMPI